MRRISPIGLVFGFVVLMVFGSGLASASPFANLPSAGQRVAEEPGLWGGITNAILAFQTEFYRSMTGAVSQMKADGTAGFWLMGFAFLYGIFHAAGPGHGKVVVSSYVLADRAVLKKGILLAFLSSLVQALVAISLVSIAAILLKFTQKQLMAQALMLEKASYAIITLLGVWLLFRAARSVRTIALKALGSGVSSPQLHSSAQDHHHDHHHHHHHHHHSHDDHTHEDHACGCGHVHMAEPQEVKQLHSLGSFLTAAVSIGLRPCTGALIVLVFALAQGVYWAGIAATFAMAVGTAITVSLIASLAVGARHLAETYSRSLKFFDGAYAAVALQLLGGLLLVAFGGLLFSAALNG